MYSQLLYVYMESYSPHYELLFRPFDQYIRHLWTEVTTDKYNYCF